MKKSIKIILMIVIAIVLIIAIVGIKLYQKEEKDKEFEQRLAELNIKYKEVLEISRSKKHKRINRYS